MRNEINFFENIRIPVEYSKDILEESDFTNIVLQAGERTPKWIEESTIALSEWRSIFASTYIRWALSINGLHVAAEKYGNPDWKGNLFYVTSLRPTGNGDANLKKIAQWDAEFAAESHLKTVNSLSIWGFVDFSGAIEDFIFQLYRIYLNHDPTSLLKGSEFQNLRKIHRDFQNSPTEDHPWHSAWNERLLNWQKRRIYDGLDKVFLSYCNTSGIKTPSNYKLTTIETWAITIKSILTLRNCLVHNVSKVSNEFQDIPDEIYTKPFRRNPGEKINVSLTDLMNLDLFFQQLLSAINLSLIERAGLKLTKEK